MAREKVNDQTRQNLVNRVAVLLIGSANGNQTAGVRLQTIRWTLQTCGFADSFIDSVWNEAQEFASEE